MVVNLKELRKAKKVKMLFMGESTILVRTPVTCSCGIQEEDGYICEGKEEMGYMWVEIGDVERYEDKIYKYDSIPTCDACLAWMVDECIEIIE